MITCCYLTAALWQFFTWVSCQLTELLRCCVFAVWGLSSVGVRLSILVHGGSDTVTHYPGQSSTTLNSLLTSSPERMPAIPKCLQACGLVTQCAVWVGHLFRAGSWQKGKILTYSRDPESYECIRLLSIVIFIWVYFTCMLEQQE